MRYSIDTSSLINAWWRLYPPDVFPAVWGNLDGLIEDGSLRATEEVLHELRRQHDELYEWARARPAMFVEIDDPAQEEVRAILNDHPRLVQAPRGRSAADPFVIALARLNEAVVVTEETRSPNPSRPKIPNVCDSLGVRTFNFLDLIRENRWVF